MSDYADLGQAKIHLNAIRHDKFSAILDLQSSLHLEKLKEMILPESKYRVFWNAVPNAKELQTKIEKEYKPHIRRYIEKSTNWRISKEIGLATSLEVTFGELFIILKYGSQKLRVKFSDIEKS